MKPQPELWPTEPGTMTPYDGTWIEKYFTDEPVGLLHKYYYIMLVNNIQNSLHNFSSDSSMQGFSLGGGAASIFTVLGLSII